MAWSLLDDDVPEEVVDRTLEHYDAIGQRISDRSATP
jgi:hypothetical protein